MHLMFTKAEAPGVPSLGSSGAELRGAPPEHGRRAARGLDEESRCRGVKSEERRLESKHFPVARGRESHGWLGFSSGNSPTGENCFTTITSTGKDSREDGGSSEPLGSSFGVLVHEFTMLVLFWRFRSVAYLLTSGPEAIPLRGMQTFGKTKRWS